MDELAQQTETQRPARYVVVEDGGRTWEPAGFVDMTVCSACADAVWSRVREVLGVLVEEDTTG
jgi:hypothetical protein